MTTILAMLHRPDDLRGLLEKRFPDLTIATASSKAEIDAQMETLAPEIVFSLKSPELPGPDHYCAVESPAVKWIQVAGSGYEHMQPFDSSRQTLTTCAGVLARYLAETTIGALIALNGHFPKYFAQQREKKWLQIPFKTLTEQTLLIVGLGHIGSWVAHNAKALGMRVIAIRRNQEAVENVDALHPPEKFLELLGEADFVSLHLRTTPETRNLMNAEAFAAMKPGSHLLNTSRAAVVDTAAMLGALDSGHLAGAYLDVFEEEPLPPDHPLWARDDVFITPHTSDNIVDYPRRYALFFAENVERWLKGEPLVNVVEG